MSLPDMTQLSESALDFVDERTFNALLQQNT
jgi:hypothetical protein